MTDTPPWQAQAACKTSPDLFYATDAYNRATARHICLIHCPVLNQCRAALAAAGPCPFAVQAGTLYNDNVTHPRPAKNQPRPSSRACPTCQQARRATPTSRYPDCGTRRAYDRHLKHGEQPCQPCTQARRDHDTRTRANRAYALAHGLCGTTNGYRDHRSRGEDPCDPCTQANREAADKARDTWAARRAEVDGPLTARVQELVGYGLDTAAICDRLGLPPWKVQRLRRRAGISAYAGRRKTVAA